MERHRFGPCWATAFAVLARQCVSPRTWLLAAAHAAVFTAAYWVAYLLRFDFSMPTDPNELAHFCSTLGWVVGLNS